MCGTREPHSGAKCVTVNVEHRGNIFQHQVNNRVGSYRLRQPTDAQDAPNQASVAPNKPELTCEKSAGGRLGAWEASHDQEEAALREAVRKSMNAHSRAPSKS